jgi:hypothetical protein
MFQYRYRLQLKSYVAALNVRRKRAQREADELGVEPSSIDSTDFKGEFLKLVRQCNCPAPGCSYTPSPLFHCGNPKTCPFCFVRLRLIPVYEGVMSLGESVLANSMLIGWSRKCSFEDGLPFFSRRTGPHGWTKAAFSVQVAVPFYERKLLAEPEEIRGRIKRFEYLPVIFHVGLHVVPADGNGLDVFRKKREALKLTSVPYASLVGLSPEEREARLRSVMQQLFAFRWEPFFTPDAKLVFRTVHDCFRDQNLIRFQKRKD